MPHRLASSILLIALALAAGPVSLADDSSHVWSEVERVVAIGDVHGSHEQLLDLLRGLDLIAEDGSWTGGRQHLVMVGDLLDRGVGDRPILDLVIRLQSEAAAAGGRVHVVLGNHEVMNLVRDMRYVAKETYADFVDLERRKDRGAARKAFLAEHRRPGVDATEISRAFEESFPPGYFGRLRAFDPDGEYGAWLLGLPAAIRINDIVFVHGGLTDEAARLGLDRLNRSIERSLRSLLAARAELERSTGRLVDRRRTIAAATDLAASGRRGAEPARAVLDRLDDLAFVSEGPFWYRGNSVENERIERSMLSRALRALDAETLVIGHTPTASGRITSRFDGRLFRTDVGMVYGRSPMALVLESSGAWVFDSETLASLAPLNEPPQGEGWTRKYEELPDGDLERFLARAEISGCRVVRIEDREGEICEAERRGLHLRAVFLDVDEPREELHPGWIARRYAHEVAAYRLDRLLGFELVPVTILREREGREGSLRIWVEPAIDLHFILQHDRRDLLEGLEHRVGEARLFDYLIGGRDRLDEAKMLLPVERRILLGDHSKAFPVGAVGIPVPDDGCEALGPSLELALRELDAARLASIMDDLLSGEQIAAILERRDRALDQCSARDRSGG